MQLNSDRGRTEYNLVSLIETEDGLAAYPIGKGSGSVTTFSHADGFLTIDQHTEIVPAGSEVTVTLLDQELKPAELVVIGSHCVGLDVVFSALRREGFRVKSLQVGSLGGLAAAKRGECDVAGLHLLEPATGEYNRPFLDETLDLIPGYGRTQCLVYRPGDERFAGRSAVEAVRSALADSGCTMVNRNAGSGTRILIDRLLADARCTPERRPAGYGVQAKSHNAVAAAVVQQRADWGVAIEPVARQYGLDSLPLTDERFDFAVPKARRERPAVRRFRELIQSDQVRTALAQRGFRI
jgi:putative molybdopterin biosynthesis protein